MEILRAGETVHSPTGTGLIKRIIPVGRSLVFEVICDGQFFYYQETDLRKVS